MERERESEQGDLNPLRTDERASVRAELEGRLRHAGVRLTGEETDDQLASVSDAVERFEDAVIAAGGDRFIDGAGSTEPDNPAYVLPPRGDDESADAYVRRVETAIARIGAPKGDDADRII